MKDPILDVAVIGAGHAGLSISFYLKQLGFSHLVFEQKNIGNSWSTQRWDSFKLNTPNNFNLLPGMVYNFSNSDSFCTAAEFVDHLKSYVETNELPVLENNKVSSVEKSPESGLFSITVIDNGKTEIYQSKKLVVASGSQNEKFVPLFKNGVSSEITQLHTSEYRNANELPAGAVLVIGSGQSGVQIAEDLVDSGRNVYLCTSLVARIPRRYRGKDIFSWLQLTGFFDQMPDDVPDPQMLKMKQPQVSGVGTKGKTISLQSLAKKGVTILGKMDNASGFQITIQPNATEHVKFGDVFSNKVKFFVDEYISKNQIDAPPPNLDPADIADENADCIAGETSINLKEKNIQSIIWTTGFVGDFGYLKLPVINADGTLKHKNGISEHEGLYFLGFPWLRKRKSGIVFGINEDSKFIAEQIQNEFS